MLLGLGWAPKEPRPALEHIDPSRAQVELARIRSDAAQLVEALPSAYEYLASIHA
jgi:tryptophan halogenase